MGRDNHNRSFFGITARFMMLVSAFLLLLCYFSVIVNPAKAWLISLFGLFFIPFVLLNIFLLLWALRRMSKALLIPLLALIPSIMFIGRYFQFSSGAAEKGEDCIKIVTYNVGNFAMGNRPEYDGDDRQEAALDSIISFLGSTGADVICLQEVFLPGRLDVTSYLKKVFPEYSSAYYLLSGKNDIYGNVTLSRFPIVDRGHFDFSQSSNQAIYTDLQIDDSVIRVYNCHFESYSISIPRIAKALGRDEEIVRETEEKMKKSIKKRPEQVDLVMSDISECPMESIVVGDFNDTPMSYSYFRLMKGKKDSFVEAGKGFGATYSILWPLIRIDYVLYPKHFDAVSFEIPHIGHSDHYPVVTEININKRSE